MKNWLLVLWLLVATSLTGCGDRAPSDTDPIPTIAPKYVVLPKSGSIICESEREFVLWELPGLPSGDPNSSRQSYRGNSVGSLKSCTKVQIDKIAWSTWDKRYYLWVAAESERGWLIEDYVDVDSSEGP
jgi:hypothetical protein